MLSIKYFENGPPSKKRAQRNLNCLKISLYLVNDSIL